MMQSQFWSHPAKEDVTKVIDQMTIDRLREAGFAVVPLRPTQEMIKVGAPFCYIVPDGDFEAALHDAGECYQAMIELGCL